MNTKELFINWIEKNKLKKTTPIKLAKLMEDVFHSCLDLDVWSIDDYKTYSDLRNKIILNKAFKKKNKKAYKIFAAESKHYQTYLKTELISKKDNYSNNQSITEENDYVNSDSDSVGVFELDNKEKKILYEFFENIDITKAFYSFYLKALEQNENIQLDVRVSIAGVKADGERLRFYSDKNGLLRFSKINKTYELADGNFDFDEICKSIREVNRYFVVNSEDVKLQDSENEQNKYVHHIDFGFGVIVSTSKEKDIFTIKFDDIPGTKDIKASHSSVSLITKEEYKSKKTPLKNAVGKSQTTRIGWDKFETALLIEAFWKIEEKKGSRSDVLTKLSNDLRKRAVNNGMKIDDMFRNFNGMSIQLANIALSFYPERSAMHRTALFDDIARIYKTDRAEFETLLKEAHRQVDGVEKVEAKVDQNTKKSFAMTISEVDFYSYIKEEYSEKHKNDGKAYRASQHAQKCIDIVRTINDKLGDASAIRDLYSATTLNDVNSVAAFLKTKLVNTPEEEVKWFWYVISRYKTFVISNNGAGKKSKAKDAANDSELTIMTAKERIDKYHDYVQVLREYFPDGFAYENAIRKKKFIRAYEELNNKAFQDSETQYKEKLMTVGFISEEKVYLPSIVSDETRDELGKYLERNLGTSVIYYSVIYEAFKDMLNADFSKDMLKQFLNYEFAEKYSFKDEYIANKGSTIDFKQELINVFANVGRPMDVEEIYSKLPNVAHNVVDEYLRDRDFVVNFRGKSYFHRDVFDIDDNQLEKIRKYLNTTIQEKEQVTGSELYSFITENIPDLLELNPDVLELGFKNVIKLLLNEEFNFKGDIISTYGRQIDVRALYQDFCRNREKFSFAELEAFRDSINQSYIDYYGVFEISIRVNEDTFVRRDCLDFDTQKIDEAILSFCTGKYVSYLDIINFHDFPNVRFPWNRYLLEGYLFLNSQKFGILNAAYNKKKPVGAIVKKQAYENFDELLIEVIRDNKLFNKDKAFEYLQENDFILTKKVKNIDLLINEAKN